MAQIEERELFGGAITGAVPRGWIDGSTLREVPDHQEMFLSPTTLSNLIFEINEYVPHSSSGGLGAVTSGLDVELPTSVHIDADSEDVAAAMYHIFDICDGDDTMDIIREPKRVPLKKLTASPMGAKASAYAGLVTFTSPRKQRREGGMQRLQNAVVEQNAASGSTPPPPDKSTNNCHFLLVRLPDQSTDLLAFVNVPQDEFLVQGNTAGLAQEEELAEKVIEKFTEVLEIKNWGLFGSQ
ncbi:hypothetical protein EYB25_005047 [Talaromyces marneffei]|uniref:Putative ran guanine nucleotide release factor n=1 Tax=Talaromyces marneffei PM1 TaxID=1077442 RepID=A0A093XNC3_TALMA|nr:uncharacterized protein EYB26_003902 [Talaromyces marneffei]KAE8553665.1 hypothetical protein EYB25_005047 [Talaromyces marneffei]QGA16235.1 hypothetical protein EYB26_003902 [Talaromyces marneffei]